MDFLSCLISKPARTERISLLMALLGVDPHYFSIYDTYAAYLSQLHLLLALETMNQSMTSATCGDCTFLVF